jgi:hypothetical protein
MPRQTVASSAGHEMELNLLDPEIQAVISRAMSRQLLDVTAVLNAAKQQMELQRAQQLIKERQIDAQHEALRREMEILGSVVSKKI